MKPEKMPQQIQIDRATKALHFLKGGCLDYVGARILLLSQLPQQGAILANTAVEKYLKAMMALRGNESYGHLKRAHWASLKNSNPTAFAELNVSFLKLLQQCYELRYTDSLPDGYNLVIASREFLAELDHAVLSLQRRVVVTRDGVQQETFFDTLVAKQDERLFKENHVLLGLDKESFIYGSPQIVYEVRQAKQRPLLEIMYPAIKKPAIADFLRPALSPIDDRNYNLSHVSLIEVGKTAA